jgi:hypothetical protein
MIEQVGERPSMSPNDVVKYLYALSDTLALVR